MRKRHASPRGSPDEEHGRQNTAVLAEAGSRLDVFCVAYLLFGSSVQHYGLLKTFAGKLCVLALFFQLARQLIRFRRWADETPHALRFFRAFALLVAWLLCENCAIWAVSASDRRKYVPTEPLQDNLLLAYEALHEALPPPAARLLSLSLEHEWISIKEKLVALIALGFAAVFDEVPYSGFGMMTRTVVCIGGARAIRTGAFMLTVIPSPRPGCYEGRFPPVPDTWREYLAIGFGKIRSGGGCNDLIVSGHGVIYAAIICAFSEYYPSWSSKLLWLALMRSNVRGPLTAQHYSVDMFMSTVITWLVWSACERVYPASARLRKRAPGQPEDRKGPLQWALTAAVFLVLVTLGVIILVGGA